MAGWTLVAMRCPSLTTQTVVPVPTECHLGRRSNVMSADVISTWAVECEKPSARAAVPSSACFRRPGNPEG